MSQSRRRQKNTVALGIGAAVLLLIGAWFWSYQRVSNVKAQRANAQLAINSLNLQMLKLADIQQLQSDLVSRQQVQQQVLRGDVSFYRLIREMAYTMPSNVHLTAVTFQKGSSGAAGTITFTGSAKSIKDVASWLDGLAQLKWISNPWVSNAALSDNTYQFNSQATLSPADVSARAPVGGVQ